MKFLATIIVLLIAFLAGCSSDSGSGVGGNQPVFNKPAGCSSLWTSTGREMQYCIRKSTTNVHPNNIIYVLHGLGGDASVILSEGNDSYNFGNFFQYAEWIFGKELPHLVSISFGPDATLPLEDVGTDVSSVVDLVNSLMPKIEESLGYHDYYDVPKRHLFGMSLGGFNALNVASIMPKQFASISVVCPALINFNAFEPTDVSSYIKRNASVVDPEMVDYFVNVIRSRYNSNENFQSRNPIQQLLKGHFDSLPVFISTGRADDYGFFEGASEFSALAKQNNKTNVQFSEASGRHCDFNIQGLASFLQLQILDKQGNKL